MQIPSHHMSILSVLGITLISIVPNTASAFTGIGEGKLIQPYNFAPPTLTGLSLLILLLYWLAWQNNPMFVRNKTQMVLHTKERGSFYSATMRSQITSYIIFLAASFLSLAIFIYQATQILVGRQELWLLGTILSGIILYHGLKYIIFSVAIKYLFLPKGYLSLIAQSYLFLNILLGVLLLPINIILTYTNHPEALLINVYIGIGLYAIYFLALSSRLFYIFLNDLSSLFYLILYLCTLEILPLWVALHASANALTINE